MSTHEELPYLFSVHEKPFGSSWQEWTRRWWLWFLPAPLKGHPALDQNGENSALGQTDPNVLFLAGTIGGNVQRNITILAGKAILFPIINVTTSYAENPSLRNEEQMKLFTKSHVDEIRTIEAYIDGEMLKMSDIHRIQSPLFEFV